jgi:ubiquinone/menaquinone biosynthesis C-methylase UbiE
MAKLVLKEFIDYPNIKHIELGSGCGNFGQQYHAECFLTENKTEADIKNICSNYHVNIFSCDAYNIPCSENRFQKIIMCNPYRYGFKDTENGIPLLSEFGRVLTNNGIVIVLSTNTNGHAMPDRVFRRISEFNSESTSVQFKYEVQTIDCDISYPNYKFFHMNGITETSPTNQIILTCLK